MLTTRTGRPIWSGAGERGNAVPTASSLASMLFALRPAASAPIPEVVLFTNCLLFMFSSPSGSRSDASTIIVLNYQSSRSAKTTIVLVTGCSRASSCGKSLELAENPIRIQMIDLFQDRIRQIQSINFPSSHNRIIPVVIERIVGRFQPAEVVPVLRLGYQAVRAKED